MRIRLSGPFANFNGNILGVKFDDGIADAPENIVNLIAANLAGVYEVDEDGEDVAQVSFDPRAGMTIPTVPAAPRTESNYPVDTAALADTVATLTETVDDLTAELAALTTRVETLEAAAA